MIWPGFIGTWALYFGMAFDLQGPKANYGMWKDSRYYFTIRDNRHTQFPVQPGSCEEALSLFRLQNEM